MKNKVMKTFVAALLAGTLTLSALSGCGGKTTDTNTPSNDAATQEQATDDTAAPTPSNEDAAPVADDGADVEHKGTIMWLAHISSGISYESFVNYGEAVCKELGYTFQVVYGDMFNDPAGNLSAVKNAMTDDVVAIISSFDGGIQNIMDEYPDLYVCGFNCEMLGVYGEGGPAASCLENDHYLGTIIDGRKTGTEMGQEYFNAVVEQGYKKISLVAFPSYAYPSLAEADAAFRAEIENYNSTADEPIELVGETKVLEFMPLEDSYFLDANYGDLDAIIAFCAGTQFVYPTMKTAIAGGTCSADTKLVTGGFEDDADLVVDIGGEGVIQYISFSASENIAYPIILLDNALNGTMYTDFKAEAISPVPFVIDSKEDIDNVMTKSLAGTADPSLAQLSMDEIKNLCTRFNPDATYADLVATFQSEQLSVDNLK